MIDLIQAGKIAINTLEILKDELQNAFLQKDFISFESENLSNKLTGKITSLNEQSFNFDSIYGQQYEVKIHDLRYFLNLNGKTPHIELEHKN